MIFRQATNTKVRIIQLLSMLSIEMNSTGLVEDFFNIRIAVHLKIFLIICKWIHV